MLGAEPSSGRQDKSRRPGEATYRALEELATPDLPDADLFRCLSAVDDADEWEPLFELVELHGIEPLVAGRVVLSGATRNLPDHVSSRLVACHSDSGSRHQLQSVILAHLLDAFRARGVDPILLKGLPLSERLYPDPAMRVSQDLDLLVRTEDRSAAEEVLSGLGYTPYRRAHYEADHFHLPWFNRDRPNGGPVELHWEVSLPYLPVRFDAQNWWERARRVQLSFAEVTLPPAQAETVYLAFHALQGGTTRLRDLVDVLLSWRVATRELSAEQIWREAAATGTTGFLDVALSMATALLALPQPTRPRDTGRSRLRAWLAREILSPETTLDGGRNLWWPLPYIGHWSMVPVKKTGLGYLMHRAICETADAADYEGRETGHLFAARVVFAVLLGLGGCLLPGRWPHNPSPSSG